MQKSSDVFSEKNSASVCGFRRLFCNFAASKFIFGMVAVLFFAAGFIVGFVLHVVLTNVRLVRRGYDPRQVLGA